MAAARCCGPTKTACRILDACRLRRRQRGWGRRRRPRSWRGGRATGGILVDTVYSALSATATDLPTGPRGHRGSGGSGGVAFRRYALAPSDHRGRPSLVAAGGGGGISFPPRTTTFEIDYSDDDDDDEQDSEVEGVEREEEDTAQRQRIERIAREATMEAEVGLAVLEAMHDGAALAGRMPILEFGSDADAILRGVEDRFEELVVEAEEARAAGLQRRQASSSSPAMDLIRCEDEANCF